MTTTDKYLPQWVCVDCYFAHHYGATEHEGEWFTGESDVPADREPLCKLREYDLADNTDSETGEGIQERLQSRIVTAQCHRIRAYIREG
jgi:hypothetical protein